MSGNKNSGRVKLKGNVIVLRLRVDDNTPQWAIKFLSEIAANPKMTERTRRLIDGLKAGIAPVVVAQKVDNSKLSGLLNRKGKK